MFGKIFRPRSGRSDSSQLPKIELPHVTTEKASELAPHEPPLETPPPPPTSRYALSSKNYALLTTVLLLLVGVLAFWNWTRVHSLERLRGAELQLHETTVDSLVDVKSDLERNIDSLQTSFFDLSLNNDQLAEKLALSTNIIAQKESTLTVVKNRSSRVEKDLRAQIQRLQTLKDRYETIISVLTQKNEALATENARLRGTADTLYAQTSFLTQRLEAQIRRTQTAEFKGTAFRVEQARRNDKMTIKARKTRDIKVSFDLNNVPPAYQGNQQLYLVISDERGLPVACKNPTRVTIRTEKGLVEIIAQGTQTQNIIDNQHIDMNYKLEDRLKKGNYVVAVYAEKGLIGAAGFRLN